MVTGVLMVESHPEILEAVSVTVPAGTAFQTTVMEGPVLDTIVPPLTFQV